MKEDTIINKKLRKGKPNRHKNEVMNLPDDSSLEPSILGKESPNNETGEMLKWTKKQNLSRSLLSSEETSKFDGKMYLSALSSVVPHVLDLAA